MPGGGVILRHQRFFNGGFTPWDWIVGTTGEVFWGAYIFRRAGLKRVCVV